MSSQRMALGEKSFALITWWVYASLSMCVYLNWSCGICWAKTESDNFCRNYFLVSWEAISYLGFVSRFQEAVTHTNLASFPLSISYHFFGWKIVLRKYQRVAKCRLDWLAATRLCIVRIFIFVLTVVNIHIKNFSIFWNYEHSKMCSILCVQSNEQQFSILRSTPWYFHFIKYHSTVVSTPKSICTTEYLVVCLFNTKEYWYSWVSSGTWIWWILLIGYPWSQLAF